jgi:hypothetical protein
MTPTGCCPPFDPEPYRDAEIHWDHKRFVKDHVTSFLHVPLNMGRKVTRNEDKITRAHADPEHQLMLADERSAFGSDIYIAVDKDVPDAEMAELSGTFRTRVYDGPFRDAGKWMRDMEAWLADQHEHVEKIYFGYTLCPACAKAYGHNYVVLFARVARNEAKASA